MSKSCQTMGGRARGPAVGASRGGASALLLLPLLLATLGSELVEEAGAAPSSTSSGCDFIGSAVSGLSPEDSRGSAAPAGTYSAVTGCNAERDARLLFGPSRGTGRPAATAKSGSSPGVPAIALATRAIPYEGYNGATFGSGALASGDYAVSVGAESRATQQSAVALGAWAAARADNAIAIGFNTIATGNNSIIVGSESQAKAAGSLVLGRKAVAETERSVALGTDSVANRGNAVSVGSDSVKRQIINVAAGTADTDAVNVKQLKDAGFTFGGGTADNRWVVYVPGSIEAGTPRLELATGAGNSGYFADTNGDGVGERDAPLPQGTRISNVANGVQDTDAVNLGQLRDISNATFDSRSPVYATAASVAARLTSRMSAAQLVAMTASIPATGSGVDSLARERAKAMKQNNYYLKVNGRGDASGDTVPVDEASSDGAFGGIAIGSDSGTSADNGIAIGALARATARDAVALGAGSVADQANTVSVGSAQANSYEASANDGVTRTQLSSAANARRVVNMAAGMGDTDAVNVDQLKQVTQALGGGAGLNPDGSFNPPSYNVTAGSYNTVGDALSALDGRTSEHSTRIAQLDSQLSSFGLGLVQQDRRSRDINVAMNTDGSRVTFTGTAGDRVLAGVAEGTVNSTSADAVNGAQLYASNAALADALGGGAAVSADGLVSAPSYSVGGQTVNTVGDAISNVDGRVSGNATAISQLGEQINQGTVGLVQQDVATRQINIAGNTDGVRMNLAGMAGDRSLGGVASGMADNDAANIAQLKVAVDGLGGGAVVNADGTISGPSYVLGGKAVSNVGDALTGMDGRVASNTAAIKELAAGSGAKYLSVKSTAAAASATGAEAVAAGSQSSASGAASVAIGHGSQASADNSLALGAGSVAAKPNSVSMGSAGKERSVTNLAAGTDDTDAVNVRQLKQSQEGVIRYDSGAGGQAVDYSSMSLGGPGGQTTTTLRNVRAGEAATDAVNVDQLQGSMGQTLGKARTYTDSRIQQVQQDAWTARREARGGTAAAMAMAGMPQAYLAGRSMLAAAASSFQGESALAIGLSGVSGSGRYVYKAQSSANTRGDFGVTVGAGIQW